VDRVLKIMDRRARLLGLDAPVRTDVTSGGNTIPISFIEPVKPADHDDPGSPGPDAG
jgi:hypothetical protein